MKSNKNKLVQSTSEIYNNAFNDDYLEISKAPISQAQFEKYFKDNYTRTEVGLSDFKIFLVKNFRVTKDEIVIEKKSIITQKNTVFVALKIVEGRHYILINPLTLEVFEWGEIGIDHIIGWQYSLLTAFFDSVHMRLNLFVTNSIHVAITCMLQGIPVICFLKADGRLTKYFPLIIKPLFKNVKILIDKDLKGSKEISEFLLKTLKLPPIKFIDEGKSVSNNVCQYIREHIHEEQTIDYLYDNIEFVNDHPEDFVI